MSDELKYMPVVTVEQVNRFRDAAMAENARLRQQVEGLEQYKQEAIDESVIAGYEHMPAAHVIKLMADALSAASERVEGLELRCRNLQVVADASMGVSGQIRFAASELGWGGNCDELDYIIAIAKQCNSMALEVASARALQRAAEQRLAAQPAAAVPEMLVVSVAPSRQYAMGWNDCRAEMLATAPPAQARPIEQEPDWSESKTGISEIWKSPFHSFQDRLLMADGAVRWRDEVIVNLRSQLSTQARPVVPEECSATGLSCSYTPHGPDGEMQCQYCGAAPAAQARPAVPDEDMVKNMRHFKTACERQVEAAEDYQDQCFWQWRVNFADEWLYWNAAPAAQEQEKGNGS